MVRVPAESLDFPFSMKDREVDESSRQTLASEN